MLALRIAAVAAMLLPAVPSFGADPETYRCEARGGRAWREYRTAHFLVATDLSPPSAEAVVKDLEQLHALVVQALFGEQVEIPGKLRAIAFHDRRDYEKLDQHGYGGYFRIDGLLTPTIVFAADGFKARPELVANELAYPISWHVFPRQPRWFAEGLGMFVATVALPREAAAPKLGTHVIAGGRETGGRWVGAAPPRLVGFLARKASAMPEDLFTWTQLEHYDLEESHYAWSWLLYHWIWNTRPKAFAEYTARLTNAEDPARAWREVFPEFDPARPGAMRALEQTLDRYRRAGRFVSVEVKAPFDARFTVAPIPSAEVHALLLLASGRSRKMSDDEVAAEMTEALREDPLHPVALRVTTKTPEARRAAMLKVTAERPKDWRGWYYLGGVADDRAEKEAALRKAVELNPEAAVARNALARLLHETGRAKEAVKHANAALDLAPWSPAAIDTLAAVAAELGKCKEAGILQRRAIDLVRGNARAEYEKRLAEIEARCGAAQPTPAPSAPPSAPAAPAR